MAKSFKSLLNKNQEIKRDSNLESENQRLRDKIQDLEKDKKNSISFINISEIKLSSNIRDDEFNYSYEEINSLAKDIEKHGQLQPVLISKDNYLITGFRRYNAILSLAKDEKLDEILAYNFSKKFNEISEEELIDLQLAENNERRDIDNFQLSNLYNDLLNKGYNQQNLSEKFKKSKSLISMIISIKNIDLNLVSFLKQFQVFGWSEKKFNALNFLENTDEKVISEFEKLKNNIGVSTLNKIAKCENLLEQKKVFLTLFKNRLSTEELNSDYFKINEVEIKEELEIKSGLKYIKQFSTFLDKFSDEEKDKVEKIKTYLSKIEILLGKV